MVVAVAASLLWMTISSWLILVNKALLSGGFPYPMALSSLGMLFSGVCSYLACRVFKVVDARRTVTRRFYLTGVMPVGALMALNLLCGNLAYLYLTVAFIQILKAFTPVITMLAMFLAGLETPTRRLVAAVAGIAVGTAVAAAGEVRLDVLGVAIMMLSEVFEAVRLVLTQRLLQGMRFHPIEGLMYLAPSCFLWLGLGSLLLEAPRMARADALAVVQAQPATFVLAAVLGFGVNSLAYIVIQASSSLTLKVLGTVKNSVVVLLGVALLGERVTLLQGVGYGGSVASFCWYQQIKMQQVHGRAPPPPEVNRTRSSQGPLASETKATLEP
ncbi:putative sugar phosphate/phosphate translocator [Auxenochlorella protothecoides]|uniref:Putative sugar phosphate/phosphate translocator n=1 Tax=Auxenochlorella protothecoides TaxID=3075 RepID=A0A087SL48_AUXPR|nr:putative sugar phosphate/phosphate translocator [Auxenochlorella protothecoides]KFM26452.1 putative sugar phosphate/phosphate translocator [Auxenochlorella protothecoides]RMZ56477.1 hypothetical protein APUTEX25_001324 [Auxenochlorella protothecoides]|eukprot:RMZ56477.1 hypothetical protein APUTEX25_001324 [Auxenochlorella protothecoides]